MLFRSPLFLRSLAMREKFFGRDDQRVGVSLMNLAELYSAEGRYTKAEPLTRRSLAIVERALGPVDQHVATLLEHLAVIYRKTGEIAAAGESETRAASIRSMKH